MRNLEQTVNAEAKHFNFKHAVAAAMTILTLGMYSGNANAEQGYVTDTKGVATRVEVRNGQVYDIATKERIGDIKPDAPGINVFYSTSNRFENHTSVQLDEVQRQKAIRMQYLMEEESKKTRKEKNGKITKSYNFKTAKQYIDAANNYGRQNNFSEVIILSEEGLRKINDGKLKATKKEFSDLEYAREVGYSLSKK